MLELPEEIDAILFDWDGTLADSLPLVTRATNEVLASHGYPALDASSIHDGMRFPTARRMAFHIGRAYEEVAGEAETLGEEFYEAADRLGHVAVELFPGVADLLARCSMLGVPMALVTNNRASLIRSLVRHAGFEDAFALIVGEENVRNPKPDPEGVRIALATLDARASRTIFVGDSITDAQAAERAGVVGVGVAWAPDSIVHGAHNTYEQICETPDELLAALFGDEVFL